MTTYHFALTDRIDVEKRRREAANRTAPRHFIVSLCDAMNGVLHEPSDDVNKRTPVWLLHRCLNTPPRLVELAARVLAECADGDVVFCIGEAIALPIVYGAKKAGLDLRVVSFGHNIRRPRIDLADRLWACRRDVDRFLVFDESVAKTSDKNVLYREQTDDNFFSPAAVDLRAGAVTERPLLVSVGLEQRDNVTLAKAVEGMPVDVAITAFSRDARDNPRASPDPMPDNMAVEFYPWPELADLYRKAAIVVVPICPNPYAAGITSVLEGAASGRPVVATANDALIAAVADRDIATWVPPLDAAALRSTLDSILGDKSRMEEMGRRARALQQEHHSFDSRLSTVKSILKQK